MLAALLDRSQRRTLLGTAKEKDERSLVLFFMTTTENYRLPADRCQHPATCLLNYNGIVSLGRAGCPRVQALQQAVQHHAHFL